MTSTMMDSSASTEKSYLTFKDVFHREEMLNLLKTALFSSGVEEEADEGIKDLIEMTMKKMDDDKDGKVSFEDFQICVRNNPLMLEAFGPCLPTGKVTFNLLSYIPTSTYMTWRILNI